MASSAASSRICSLRAPRCRHWRIANCVCRRKAPVCHCIRDLAPLIAYVGTLRFALPAALSDGAMYGKAHTFLQLAVILSNDTCPQGRRPPKLYFRS